MLSLEGTPYLTTLQTWPTNRITKARLGEEPSDNFLETFSPSLESKDVVFAYAPIGACRSSIVLFFPRQRPARAAGAGGANDGTLSAPCAVVAPPSGPLAPVCSAICRFSSLQWARLWRQTA
jgi:hypothetical protein